MEDTMEELINKLLTYKSDNDFEEAEKLAFANFLKKNDDAYYRTNTIAHITASSWIVNEDFSKVYLGSRSGYNSIFNSVLLPPVYINIFY